MVVEFLLRGPCRAIDALQHRTIFVAPPIRAGYRLQLEWADAVRRFDVRTAAEIEKLTLLIGRDFFAFGESLDQLDLVRVVAEEIERFLAADCCCARIAQRAF